MSKLREIYHFFRDVLFYSGLIKSNLSFDGKIDYASKKANIFLKNFFKRSKLVFEYGSGNSTYYMQKQKIKYISIESKKDIYLKLKKDRLNIFFYSLGITKRFSVPYFIKFKKKKILRYVNAIKSFKNIKPDLIFIDGRFRVLCFFYIIDYLRSKKRTKTIIMIDDFNRKEYQVINKYFKVNKVGRIGYTDIKKQKKIFRLKEIESTYLFDPS